MRKLLALALTLVAVGCDSLDFGDPGRRLVDIPGHVETVNEVDFGIHTRLGPNGLLRDGRLDPREPVEGVPDDRTPFYTNGLAAWFTVDLQQIHVVDLEESGRDRTITLNYHPYALVLASDGSIWVRRDRDWLRYAPDGSFESRTITSRAALIDAYGDYLLVGSPEGLAVLKTN